MDIKCGKKIFKGAGDIQSRASWLGQFTAPTRE